MKQRNIGEQIKKLREEGKTYNQIKEILQCAKSTISYHLGDGQKEKSLNRLRKQRKLNPWLQKGEHFVTDTHPSLESPPKRFSRRDLKKHLEGVDKCYLTGRKIDIMDPKSYHFDHITPKSKGGKSIFENLGVTTPEANQAKSDMTVEEFIELCKDVLTNFGYKVEKK